MTTTMSERNEAKAAALPGQPVSEERVRELAGFQQSPIPLEQRLQAHRWIEGMHQHNLTLRSAERSPRRLHNEVVLVTGRRERGIVAVYHLAQLYAAGIPVFHNGIALFGREIPISDFPLLAEHPVHPEGAAVYLDEIHVVNTVMSGELSASPEPPTLLREIARAGYWIGIGTGMPGLVGQRVLSQLDEIWRGSGLSDPEVDPLKRIYCQNIPSARLHKWFFNGGDSSRRNLNYLRAVISSDELGVGHEPKPIATQHMDWGWLRFTQSLTDDWSPIRIGAALRDDRSADALRGAMSATATSPTDSEDPDP